VRDSVTPDLFAASVSAGLVLFLGAPEWLEFTGFACRGLLLLWEGLLTVGFVSSSALSFPASGTI